MNKRKKRIIVIAVCCAAVLSIYCIGIIIDTWTLLPIKSSPHTLSIVLYDSFDSNKPVINLGNYIDGKHFYDYMLTIENGVHIQEPQSYKLPDITSGTIEVNIELGDDVGSKFTIVYNQARDLYRRGLLIYLTSNQSRYVVGRKEIYDKYVYLVSGKTEECYFKGSYSGEWIRTTDAPPLKRVLRNQPQPYSVWDSGWKENKWVITPAA